MISSLEIVSDAGVLLLQVYRGSVYLGAALAGGDTEVCMAHVT